MSKAGEQQEESKYTKLSNINVNEHVEKKGRFFYLSWAWAIDTLRKFDPTAIWEVRRFDGKPYLKTECGYFVEVAVTIDGATLSQIHPVLDNNNRPITQPNSFQINTSIQRCLVKAIALHGLGLYIYAGEDLPEDNTTERPAVPRQAVSTPAPSDKKDEIPDFKPDSEDRSEWVENPKPAADEYLTFDELREKILATTALPHLKNVWVKYKADIALLPVDETKRLIAVKDAKKKELAGGGSNE